MIWFSRIFVSHSFSKAFPSWPWSRSSRTVETRLLGEVLSRPEPALTIRSLCTWVSNLHQSLRTTSTSKWEVEIVLEENRRQKGMQLLDWTHDSMGGDWAYLSQVTLISLKMKMKSDAFTLPRWRRLGASIQFCLSRFWLSECTGGFSIEALYQNWDLRSVNLWRMYSGPSLRHYWLIPWPALPSTLLESSSERVASFIAPQIYHSYSQFVILLFKGLEKET